MTMRPIAIALSIAALAVLTVGACHQARAQLADPPVSMSVTDAAKLDAALSHLRELQAAARPYEETVADVFARNRIDAREFGRTVTVDFATGEIRRQQAAPK